MASRIFISAFFLILFTSFALAAHCDSKGKCKYGGRCNKQTNQCICPMNCGPKTWRFDMDGLYCLPKQGGGYSKIFLNICFVMAEACEKQRDVPLIKFEYKKPQHLQCLAKNADKWGLCPKPEDFMGQCGGTLDQTGLSSDSGVCLKNKRTRRTRCQCSQNRYGENCAQKVILLQDKKINLTHSENSSDYLGVSIGASLGAGVLLGMLIYAIISACCCQRKRNSDAEKQQFDGNNTFNEKSKSNSKNNSYNNDVLVIVGDHRKLSSTHSTDSAASNSSSKRQRLNGFSINGRNTGDSNNNISSQGSEKELEMNTKSHSYKKTTEENVPHFDQFTQEVSKISRDDKEAYTI